MLSSFGGKDPLHKVTRAVAAAKKALQRAKAKEQRGGLTFYQMTVAITVFLISGWDVLVAAAYVHEQLRRQSLPPVATPFAEELVERSVLSMDVSALLKLQQPETKREHAAFNAAVRYWAQVQVTRWVRCQNREHGVAPTLRQAALAFVVFCRRVGACEVADKLAASIEDGRACHNRGRAVRKWGQQFRLRANFVLQVPKPGMDLSPEDVRCKARAPKNGDLWVQFLRSILSSNTKPVLST